MPVQASFTQHNTVIASHVSSTECEGRRGRPACGHNRITSKAPIVAVECNAGLQINMKLSSPFGRMTSQSTSRWSRCLSIKEMSPLG